MRLVALVHTGDVKSAQASLPLLAGETAVLWRRSARARRVSLRIDARVGKVVVTLPTRASRAAGVALLADNAAWVAQRLAALPPPIAFAPGGSVTIDGAPHPIRHAPDAHGGAWFADGTLHVTGEAEFLPRRVRDFLRAEARRRFAAAALAKAAAVGLAPRRVTVKDTSSRWGSCAPNGVLMFCWRLIMAPPFVQDYVVGHEVAHLRHLNHGAAFWSLCDSLSPHRVHAEAWLRTQGAALLRTG